MTTILITGFTPFPGAPENPTAELVKWVQDGKIKAPDGVRLEARLLPTEFEKSFAELKEHLGDIKPDALIEFGLSAKATGFALECIARNQMASALPDNSGFRPDDKMIETDAPLVLPTGLPVEDIYEDLTAKGLPVEYSQSAGGYVCNHLFYKTLRLTHSERPRQAGFIHLPYLVEQRDRLEAEGKVDKCLEAISRDALLAGVQSVLEACIFNIRA